MALRSKSGIKRARQTQKRRARNVDAKKKMKTAVKAADKAIKAKSADAKDLVKKAISVIDKTAQRGIIHKNKASRQKARLTKRLNKAK